jgi:6-pyruvoyltetrahydropterin/6-carboxytetrahydropterin synthase
MKDSKNLTYSIKVKKEYLNFSSAHFLVFDNGTREPLHGHNYKVKFEGEATSLDNKDMVFDFLDIKPLIKKICDSLDHKLLLPKSNEHITISEVNSNIELKLSDNSFFSFPKIDTLILDLHNISAESLASYLHTQIEQQVYEQFDFHFTNMTIEVEETTGQSAVVKTKI